MPYRRRYRRKRPSRRRRRRYKRSRQLTNYAPSGMPTQRIAKLRYAEQTTITSTSGVLDSIRFRANGIFDPNVDIGGHQPMGFDQWSTLFNHYVVLGSKLTMSIVPFDAGGGPCATGAYLTDGSTVPYTSASEFMEAKKGTVKLISPDQRKATYVVSKFSAKKFYNVKDVKDNVSRIGSPVSADPSDQAYYVIWVQNRDGSTSSYSVLVQIDYIVLFSEPKDLTQS